MIESLLLATTGQFAAQFLRDFQFGITAFCKLRRYALQPQLVVIQKGKQFFLKID